MSLINKFETGDDKIRKSHVKNLIKMAGADGHIDDVELDFLNKIAKRYGVDKEEVNHIIANPNQYTFTPPANKQDRYEQMINLMRMVMADGIVDDNEMKYSEKFAIGLAFPFEKINQVIQVALKGVQAGKKDDDIIEDLENLLE